MEEHCRAGSFFEGQDADLNAVDVSLVGFAHTH